jgi:hypothetical protein
MAKHFFLTGIVALVLAGAAAPVSAGNPAPDREICARAIAPLERAYEVPGELMQAVALAESGRWDATRQEKYAWPWTVTAGGKGEFFADKAAAIAHVRKLQAQGRRNIDVGCMQVNLQFHPDAFASLEQAFDPAENVAYAAEFLLQLKAEHQSWIKAVGSYHSRTPANFTRYRAKVFAAWREERKAERERQRAVADAKREGLVEALDFRHAGPVPPTITAWAE